MKAPRFDYVRPTALAEALDVLAGEADARVLAGGQSFVPALNLRLASPGCVVDINRIAGLAALDRRDGMIVMGALVRHAEVLDSPLIGEAAPLLAAAMAHVAHPAIRNRGTVCGSLAYADPAAELPACAVALDATLVLRRRGGARAVVARDFFRGIYQTARQDDEMITEVRFPAARAGEIFGFDELARRHGDFALVGMAARARRDGAVLRDLDLVVFGAEPKPRLSAAARRIAEGQAWSPDLGAAIVAGVVGELEPMDSPHGRPETRRRQAAALVGRALTRMMEGADADPR